MVIRLTVVQNHILTHINGFTVQVHITDNTGLLVSLDQEFVLCMVKRLTVVQNYFYIKPSPPQKLTHDTDTYIATSLHTYMYTVHVYATQGGSPDSREPHSLISMSGNLC